ncbi:GtrA family protein [Telluria aromaticivorans]|uniref:GtrA family protein n=1 Tax=Telluria aromaticivorans TaxID=2725995 RepID=A0A7Y2NZA8_9BURK|nr:GtrA family protein [Telluria aromaticivorans]NNG22948.1 GtrA family protein [Telluria aromaticivorans]
MSLSQLASLILSRQFAVFVTGGLVCALADVGLMQLLLANGVATTAAASAGFGAGLLVNYAFHSRVTFNSAASPANFTRYLCVVGVNYLLTIGCVALADANLDNPLLGKLLSLPLVAVNGYLLSKYWIFK